MATEKFAADRMQSWRCGKKNTASSLVGEAQALWALDASTMTGSRLRMTQETRTTLLGGSLVMAGGCIQPPSAAFGSTFTFSALLSASTISARGSFHVRIPMCMRPKVHAREATRGATPAYHISQSSLPSITGAMSKATMDMSFNKMSKEGPEVSLKGSPTVSPTTQALPTSDFLIPNFSHNFLELSQAPPALPIITASMAALPMHPARRPITARAPTPRPTINGVRTA
mmetsp:Transcript_55815/g.120123  ORF Transcript_55815/g.120123 Transcript_55815/m.120123 type:complete len:229 (-) Transcript_55815:1884-2570(-)